MRNLIMLVLLACLTACVSVPQYQTIQTFTGPMQVPVQSEPRVAVGITGDSIGLGGWVHIKTGNGCYITPSVSKWDGKSRKYVRVQC